MKYMMILMLAVSLLLCGCDWVADDGYYFVTPHTQQTLPAEDMEVNASTYSELYQALTNMVREGVENRIVYVADYNFSLLEEDAARVVDEVLKTDPVAAYAVEEMKLEQGTNGGREALAVNIRYRHDRSQIKRIRTVQTMAEAQTMIAAELDQCSTGIVLLVKEYAQADLAQVVEDYAAYSPQTVMEIPQTTVNIYPEEGVERIVELKFSYQNSRDALRGMQIQVSPVFTSAVLYVSGDGTEYEKFTQLYSFLMERYDYQLETSITPAYSLLRHGVGDYKAFANVYAAVCREAGLQCVTVSGTREGEPWMWNLICADGEYYHVDLLRSNDAGRFQCYSAAQMAGYVWDYSAFPDTQELHRE